MLFREGVGSMVLPLSHDFEFFGVSVCGRVDKVVDIRRIFFYQRCLKIVEVIGGCQKK